MLNIGDEMNQPSVQIKRLNDLEIDFVKYLSWMRDIKSNGFIEAANSDYSLTELKEYVKSRLVREDVVFWGIFLSSDEFIGTVKLEPISFELGQAWLGIMIGAELHRGKGFGFQAIMQVVDFASTELKLDTIFLGVSKANHHAISLYNRIGFKLYEERDLSIIMSLNLERVSEP